MIYNDIHMPGKCELSMKRSSCLLEIYIVRIKAVTDHSKHDTCYTIDDVGEHANCEKQNQTYKVG